MVKVRVWVGFGLVQKRMEKMAKPNACVCACACVCT